MPPRPRQGSKPEGPRRAHPHFARRGSVAKRREPGARATRATSQKTGAHLTVDEPLIWYEGADTSLPHWLIADRQGSIIATTDASGVATTYAYDPYGRPREWTGPRFRYTGQAALPELELYHYKARVYDPALGRFLQTDPIGYEDELNLYAYVQNDPLNLTDPTGKCSSIEDAEKQANCLAEREVAVQQAADYLETTPQRQAEAAFISTYNADTGEVTVRTGNEAGIRTHEDVQFTGSGGRPLRARPDGRIVEQGEDGVDRDTNEIILVTGHGHPRTESRGLDRANESIRDNEGDQALSRIAPAVIRTPSGRIRVFVGGLEREIEEE